MKRESGFPLAWMDGARGGGSKGGRGAVCVVAWWRRGGGEGEMEKMGQELGQTKQEAQMGPCRPSEA